MSENSNGRQLLAEKDFVDVVNEAGEVVGSVPKHWGDEQLAAGLKKKSGRAAKAKDPVPDPDAEPKANASREDWVAFATKVKGAAEADLVADGKDLTRDELVAKYGTPSS